MKPLAITLFFMLISISMCFGQYSVADSVFEKRSTYILSDLKFEVTNGPGLNNYIKVSDQNSTLGCVAAEPSRLAKMERKLQELQPFLYEYQNAEVLVVVDKRYGNGLSGLESPQCENLLPLKIVILNK